MNREFTVLILTVFCLHAFQLSSQIKTTYYLDSNAVEYVINCTNSIDEYLPILIANKQTVILNLNANVEIKIDSIDYSFESITNESYQKLHEVLKLIYVNNVDSLIITTEHSDSFVLNLSYFVKNIVNVKYFRVFQFGGYLTICNSFPINDVTNSFEQLCVSSGNGYTIDLSVIDKLRVQTLIIASHSDSKRQLIGKSTFISSVLTTEDKKFVPKRKFKTAKVNRIDDVEINFPSYSSFYIRTGWPNIGRKR